MGISQKRKAKVPAVFSGYSRTDSKRDLPLSPTYDRGPLALTDIEGDLVHAVGVMIAAERLALSLWRDAVQAYMMRTGTTPTTLAGQMGVDKQTLLNALTSRGRMTPTTLQGLRRALCNGVVLDDQLAAGNDDDPLSPQEQMLVALREVETEKPSTSLVGAGGPSL